MKISIEWFSGKYQQFNVSLASAEGREAFLVVKGCRIVDGREGRFISWPATKNEKTGKYWNHVWAGEAFAAAVLAEAEKTQPRDDAPSRGKPAKDDFQDSVPF